MREQRGNAYFAQLARTAAVKRTTAERQAIHSKAAAERRRRLHTMPRTIVYDEAGDRVTERIVPWWPHQKNRQRRTKPVFVRIELSRVSSRE